MTWNTPQGPHVLQGAEARLIRFSVACMVDEVVEAIETDPEAGSDFGVALFDDLNWRQRMVLLETVARHLLTTTPQELELTAIHEATVGAIYANVVRQLELQLVKYRLGIHQRERDTAQWRQMILDAVQQPKTEDGIPLDEFADGFVDEFADDPRELPDADCACLDEWEFWVESLADRVLWDRDYEMALFMDTSPETAAMLKDGMGVEDDYFVAVSSDPRDTEIHGLIHSARQIVNRKPR